MAISCIDLIKMCVWHVLRLCANVHRYDLYSFMCENMSMASAKVRLRCSWISLIFGLFDQNMSMACAKVILRFSCISLVLIYLIKMWISYVAKLDSDVDGYH